MGSWRLNPCEVKARLSERQGQAEARCQQPAGAQAGGPGPGAGWGHARGWRLGRRAGGQVGGRRAGPSLSSMSPSDKDGPERTRLKGTASTSAWLSLRPIEVNEKGKSEGW